MNIKMPGVKEIEIIIEATPREGMTLDELEARMKELGNRVIERRDNTLVVGYAKQKVT